MRKPMDAVEAALMKNQNTLPGMPGQNETGNGGQAMPAQPTQEPAGFQDVVAELQQLVLEKKLPPDFDLQQACMDKAFAELIAAFPAEAALRIYYAESKAAQAEQSAMQRVNAQVQSRRALPRSARGGAMSAPMPNYRDMDDASFRKLLAEMKRSARNGNAPRL